VSEFGIKINNPKFDATLVKIMRQFQKTSIMDLKRKVEGQDYIYCCDYLDDNGIKTLLSLRKALAESGISTTIYENGQVLQNEELLDNLLISYAETAQQVEYIMEQEAEGF